MVENSLVNIDTRHVGENLGSVGGIHTWRREGDVAVGGRRIVRRLDEKVGGRDAQADETGTVHDDFVSGGLEGRGVELDYRVEVAGGDLDEEMCERHFAEMG